MTEETTTLRLLTERLTRLEQENAELHQAIVALQDAQARTVPTSGKQIAALDQGEERVTSRQGKGTTRRILLRATVGAAATTMMAGTFLGREPDAALAQGRAVNSRLLGHGQVTLLYPIRIVDTRLGLGGTTLGSNSTLLIPVAGTNGIPINATGVLVNLVGGAVGNSVGNLVAYPAGLPVPETSNLNYWNTSIRYISTFVVCALGVGRHAGQLAILNQAGPPNSVDVVVDVFGFVGGSFPVV